MLSLIILLAKFFYGLSVDDNQLMISIDDSFVYDLSVFVLDTPGNTSPLPVWEIYQASGSLPGPWAVLPLRVSHRAVL